MLDRKEQIAGLIDNFRAVQKAMIKIAPSFLKELNITYTQIIILGLIKENEGLSLKELAGTMGITSSAATQQVNNLVKRGYLVREESNLDRRFVKIRLSGEMDKQVEVFKDRFLEQFFKFFSELTDEELTLYCKFNNKIADQILQR
jgi:DNA-binding MarR family transcriptional regulator